MAEPLQTLFSRIRRPRARRRMQWEPIALQGGSSPGMRGTINPLDSVAMSDSAQGVDISSVAPPTRLTAARMDEAYQPQEVAAIEEEGASSPFMLASQRGGGTPAQVINQGGVRYQRQCNKDTGVCQMVPVLDGAFADYGMQMMPQASALPEGVTLNPGETYVPGSLREVARPPAAASAPPATAMPQQPAPAAALPQEQPGPGAVSQARPPVDVRGMFAPALQRFRDAENAPTARAAVTMGNTATAEFRAAEIAVREARAMELDRKSDELERLLIERGQLQLNLKDPAYLQQQRQKTIAGIRSNMSRSIQDRATEIVEYRIQQTPNLQYTPEAAQAAVQQEERVIFSMDAANYYRLQLAAQERSSKAKTPEEKATRDLQKFHLEGMLVQSINRQFAQTTDNNQLREQIDASLRQPFYHSAVEHLKSVGRPEEEAQAEAAIVADRMVDHAFRRVTSVRSGGPLYLKPAAAPQQPAAQQAAPQTPAPQPAASAPTGGGAVSSPLKSPYGGLHGARIMY